MSREPAYTEDQIRKFGLDPERLPRHVAIIMDGNGRWAQQRGLPRIEGHRNGVHSVRAIVEECSRLGIQQLTLYCFSSENWKRPKLELTLLMKLLKRYLVEERKQIQEQGLRFRVIGRIHELDAGIQEEIARTEAIARDNTGMMLCLAVNYGSRMEIADAVQRIGERIANGELTPAEINEQTVGDHLLTAGMPDPDLVIRTASELRVSNYLLWQISYAELYISESYWPDFREPQFHESLKDFAARDRRFGGLKQSESC